MAGNSHIEWTDATWNPVTGCTKISPACKHCYAERLAKRLQAMGQRNYSNGFSLTLQPHMLEVPLKWKRPNRIFVNSMSDLFHEDVPVSYIRQVFDVMRRADWHQYQLLTKRSERLLKVSPTLEWRPYIWMGVSVENEDYTFRIDHLRRTGAQRVPHPAAKRIEGEPAKSPSFWVKRSHFVHEYAPLGEFWLPARLTSEAELRIFGRSQLSITYTEYPLTASQMARK